MLQKFLGRFSRDIGIDFGTTNTLFYVRERGIIVNEPTVAAINTRTDQLIAVGHDAKKMMGKTPPHIAVTTPIVNGVISDFEVCEKLIKHFIGKIHTGGFTFAPRPRVVVSIPLDITEVERKAVHDVITSAGARAVHLIEEPIAAAIGARLNLEDSYGRMIVEIGGGKTSMAVISLSGVVSWQALRVAGDQLDKNIQEYIRDTFNVIIGIKAAEYIKIKIGSASEQPEPLEMKIKGRNALTGLPKEFTITDGQVREAMKRSVRTLVEHVRTTVENAPAELISDLHDSGIVLSGGGSLLRGIESEISKEIQMPVHVIDDPLTTVVRGTGILLDDEKLLREVESLGSTALH